MNFKRYLFVLISFIFATAAQAQSSKTSTRTSSFLDSVTIAPTIGTIYTDFEVDFGPAGIDALEEKVTPLPGLTIGLEATLNTNDPYVDYQTGLIYSRSRAEIEARFQETVDFGSGPTNADYYVQNIVDLERISLPILARVFPLQKDVRFYLKGGFLIHHQMRAYSNTSQTRIFQAPGEDPVVDTDSNKTSSNEGLRAIVPDALVGVGYEFNVTDSFGLNTELGYQRSLLSISTLDSDGFMTNIFYFRAGIGF